MRFLLLVTQIQILAKLCIWVFMPLQTQVFAPNVVNPQFHQVFSPWLERWLPLGAVVVEALAQLSVVVAAAVTVAAAALVVVNNDNNNNNSNKNSSSNRSSSIEGEVEEEKK